jgi:exodeoxyribonuclease V beta subunit
MSDVHPPLLQALRFPLRGNALIEASAGTGKTFTIAALYLRLVLGHGDQAAFDRPLMPPEILVVTFTEAATKELRDRIRARLAQAAAAFLLDPATVAARPAGEDLLHDLRASYPEQDWPGCARRLQVAAEWMDEAAVSTIHGWCNRMLREHAFDSGSLFSQTLETDERDLLDEATRDYWRTFFYPLPAADTDAVRGWWTEPAALARQLARLLPHADLLGPAREPAEALEQARIARAETLAELRQPWQTWCEELDALLTAAVRDGQVHGQKLQQRFYGPWLQDLRRWCRGECDEPMPAKSTGWTRLTRAGLREAWKSGEPPEHPAFENLESLRERLAGAPDARHEVLAHAVGWVAQRIAREQHRRAQMGFGDLLTRLHAALHDDGNGERLAALIRQQFPVALIDEFQDTDPVQYGIFRRIYGGAAAASGATSMVLIGDPKQAIYAFRGADIYTYLAARSDTAGRHFTLGTNYRSTTAMVQAVNHFFDAAERRSEGAGAFLFRTAEGNPLPFYNVEAQGRKDRWVVQRQEAPALTCWWHEAGAPVRAGEYRKVMAAACAAEIVRLLRLGQGGDTGFVQADGSLQPLRPRDIAVLVNSGTEALAVRQALAAGGVRSVYLSDRDSVFDTAAAAELQRLLQACAEPDDARLVRAALGTGLLALDWKALDRLNHDEVHWEERVEAFHAYRRQWRRQGVLPMVRQLLHDFHVPRRLIAAGDERQLTDLLHLAELLQQASALLQGEHALLRHLAEQRQDGGAGADNRQVRLESDADLLKVVTVHKSKGLEYPLVFLPFPATCWPVDPEAVPIKWHDDDGRARVSLLPDAEVVRQADRERLGEDLRKLYVALTRARHASWIGVAVTDQWPQTALGYLLDGSGDLPPGNLQAMLEATLAPGAIHVAPAPQASQERYRASAATLQLAPPPPLAQAHRERWWIASYSRLLTGADGTALAAAPETAQEANYFDDEAAEPAGDDALQAGPPGTLHAFPRGASPGTFLHGLLEWLGRQGFAAMATAPGELAALLARRCNTARWKPHQSALNEWLTRWLATPLDLSRLAPGSAPLAPAGMHGYQVEMEFWFSASQVKVRALDRLVTAHTLRGEARPALAPQQLNGMLKGFMDLVFEHEGRYFVADYKSNWLGETDAHYTAKAMRDEVLRKRYELQYSLYLFALHRLLRARLPDYDYDRHVGGAVYVFLRGHAAATQGLHMERPPRALMDALDALFAGTEAEVDA